MKSLAELLYFAKKLFKKSILSRRLNLGQNESLGKYVWYRILSSLKIKQNVNTSDTFYHSTTAKRYFNRLMGLGQ